MVIRKASGVDWAVLRRAASQHDLVTYGQLMQLGLSPSVIAHRVRTGRLHRVHHGVYAVGRPTLSRRGRQLAAVLACGPAAALSHRSAGSLWELVTTAGRFVDVTVAGSSRRRQKRIRIHRTRRLAAEEVTMVDGIPVTSVARTLVDFAGDLGVDALRRAVEQADRNGTLDVAAVGRALQRAAGRRGIGRLRRILADYVEPAPVRSELERRFLELVLQAGLPRPRVNSRVAGLEVDFFWPQWHLVVELDGRAYHSDVRSFERDRVRDARLQRARCRVLRVTHRRMIAAADEVIDDVRALAALADAA